MSMRQSSPFLRLTRFTNEDVASSHFWKNTTVALFDYETLNDEEVAMTIVPMSCMSTPKEIQ